MWCRRVAFARPVIALARPVAQRIVAARIVPPLPATRIIAPARWFSSSQDPSNRGTAHGNEAPQLWESEADSNLPDGLRDEDIKAFMLGEWDPPRRYNPPRRFLYKLQRQLEVFDLWPMAEKSAASRLQNKKWLLAAVHRLGAQGAFLRMDPTHAADADGPIDAASMEAARERLRWQKAGARKMLTIQPDQLDGEPEMNPEKQERHRIKQILHQQRAAEGRIDKPRQSWHKRSRRPRRQKRTDKLPSTPRWKMTRHGCRRRQTRWLPSRRKR